MPPVSESVQSEWSGSQVIDGQAGSLPVRFTIDVDASGKISGFITNSPDHKIAGTIYPSSKIDFTYVDPDGDDIKYVGQLDSGRKAINGTWSVAHPPPHRGGKFELNFKPDTGKDGTALPSVLFDKPKAIAENSQVTVDSTKTSVGDSNPTQPSIIDSTKSSVGNSKPAQPPIIDNAKPSVGDSKPAQPSIIDDTKSSVSNSKPAQPPIIDNTKPSVDDSKPAQPSIIDNTKPSVGDSNPAQPSIIDGTKSSVGNSKPAQPPINDNAKPSVGDSKPAQPSIIDGAKSSVGNSKPAQPPIIDNTKPSVGDSKPAQQSIIDDTNPAELPIIDNTKPSVCYFKPAQPASVSSVSSELRQTELLGGKHNTPFNDAIDIGGYPATQTIKGIVKIVLQFGDIIDGFEVSYKLNDGSVKRVHHGTTPPTRFKIKTRTITFESTEILAAVFGRWLNGSVNAIDEIGFIIFDSDTEKLTIRQEGPFSATNHNPKFYIPGPILAFAGYAKNGSEHCGLNSLSFLKYSTSLADVAVFDAIKPISLARAAGPTYIYWFPDQVDCRRDTFSTQRQEPEVISLNWAAPITITTWIKYELSVDRCIFHTECDDVDRDDSELHYKMTSENEFTVSTKSSPQMKLMSNPLPRSTWSFVVVVFQGTTVMLYLDDNEPKSGKWAGPKTTSGEKTTVHVGYSDWGGYIRDFKVYQHALTQSQITTEFQSAREIAIQV